MEGKDCVVSLGNWLGLWPTTHTASRVQQGIVNLNGFDEKLGNTGIHESLIIQNSGYWLEVENQSNWT